MSDNEQKLLSGLRALASDGPQQPPAYIEAKLLAEVRRRARQRRWFTWAPVAAVAAGLVVMLSMQTRFLHPASAVTRTLAVDAQAQDMDSDFYPVPGTEALPAYENAMVVRVELPLSSLRMMGFPVNEGGSAESVEADVLLGQDGVARGVRVVE